MSFGYLFVMTLFIDNKLSKSFKRLITWCSNFREAEITCQQASPDFNRPIPEPGDLTETYFSYHQPRIRLVITQLTAISSCDLFKRQFVLLMATLLANDHVIG